MTVPPYGFISYAHDDAALFAAFRKDVSAVEARFGMKFHEDTGIAAGTVIDPAIQAMIAQAHVFILLASRSFVASGYVRDIELPAIETRRKAAKGLVIPVVLEECAHDLIGRGLQAVPKVGGRVKPICQFTRRAAGCDLARQQIDIAIGRHYGVPMP